MTTETLNLTKDLLTVYLANNQVPYNHLVPLIQDVHGAVAQLADGSSISSGSALAAPAAALPAPADEESLTIDVAAEPTRASDEIAGGETNSLETAPLVDDTVSSAPEAPSAPAEAASPAEAPASSTISTAPSETATTPAGEAPAPASAKSQQRINTKVAPIRQEDISDPVFAGLDPWLAKRISPAVAAKLDANNPIHPSVFPEFIVCLEDGGTAKLLRPYVENRFEPMTLDDYKRKWHLPVDYPHAAPAYLERKRATAQASGLGTKVRAASRTGAASKAETVTAAATARAGRGAAAKAEKPEAAKATGRRRSAPVEAPPAAAPQESRRAKRRERPTLGLYPANGS
ncbi:MucR family transcriptional regulator [Sphingosinicella sp. BN140058]|uniref:MucR family transcriptional regulator n=1 Tax=Sphingosinicella sp. BN140058 TaxID=1892855 RepID=UPI001013638E|nr:MucR family transcriptional regulator [Sphingosinicella sp. BN140058]QAY80488.1 hypothetical protein ETR14_28015 [Sphingosinicella sp. BN140058]